MAEMTSQNWCQLIGNLLIYKILIALGKVFQPTIDLRLCMHGQSIAPPSEVTSSNRGLSHNTWLILYNLPKFWELRDFSKRSVWMVHYITFGLEKINCKETKCSRAEIEQVFQKSFSVPHYLMVGIPTPKLHCYFFLQIFLNCFFINLFG